MHVLGHGFFEKITKIFFKSYGPEIHRKLHKWCCGRILKLFRLFRGKKNFVSISHFLSFFAYPGSWILWKITKIFFESYWPEIHRKLHKWCCGRILKLFRLFRAKKKFVSISHFLSFFPYPGSWNFWKITKFFFESYGPEIHRKLQKWCCGCILKLFRLFRGKKIFV